MIANDSLWIPFIEMVSRFGFLDFLGFLMFYGDYF
jgi:hypothetical protein